MTKYQAICSRVLNGDELSDIISQFEKKYRKLGLNSYRKDGSTCDLLCRSLPSLAPFAEVLVAHFASLPDTPTDPATLKKLILDWGPTSRGRATLSWRVRGIDFGGQTDRSSLIYAGLEREGFVCGIGCSLDENVGYNDRQVRARFFEDIVATRGLGEQIRTHWEGDRFRIEASSPWNLHCKVGQLGGWNPYSIMISGFSTMEESISQGEAIAAKYGNGRPDMAFGGNFSKATFEQVRDSLGGRPGPWKVSTLGALGKEAKAALMGTIDDKTPPGPIPAFEWHAAKTEEQVFGSITVEGAGARLELSVEHRAECDLLAEVAFLSDLGFQEVAFGS
jgi:hypothetical protein